MQADVSTNGAQAQSATISDSAAADSTSHSPSETPATELPPLSSPEPQQQQQQLERDSDRVVREVGATQEEGEGSDTMESEKEGKRRMPMMNLFKKDKGPQRATTWDEALSGEVEYRTMMQVSPKPAEREMRAGLQRWLQAFASHG